jgi:cellobiose-specific phosphotransferase system component IIB
MKHFWVYSNHNSLVFCFFLILFTGCTTYPICNNSNNCYIFGENQKIIIPLIIPTTSTKNILSLDIQRAFEQAFQENTWFLNNTEIAIEDSFDAQDKNIELLLPYLEKIEIPLIFNIAYSVRDQYFYNLLESSGKVIITSTLEKSEPKNIFSFIPENQDLFNQAYSKLPDFIYTNDFLLISDYVNMQNEKIATLCQNKNVKCEQIDTYQYEPYLANTGNPLPIIIISEKKLILNWLINNHPNSGSLIIVIDTSFANPAEFLDSMNSLYWIGPDIWIKSENKLNTHGAGNQDNWAFTQSYIAYQVFKNVFNILEPQLSETKNGFRQINPDLIISQLKNSLIEPNYKFHIYQLQNSQYIMSEPIKLDLWEEE